MINLVFAVYDSKAECYSNPFLFTTRGMAHRSWETSCADEKAPYNQHPEDFTLFELGSYNTLTGELVSLKTPISMGTALEILSKADGPVRGVK